MAELRIAKLPDRNPVKLTIAVMPDLHDALQDYAKLYAETYGQADSMVDLIPAMLTAFLDSDREFQKARKGRG
ncbi:MAG: DUF2274 domain-containing protein [Sphingomonadaceae bacterium]|nr:DUF2274 domain-containing protein [Sphingomonadaceae bacterium]